MGRILCLHGFHQNAGILAHKIRELTRALQRQGHEVSFLDGPLLLDDACSTAGPLRGWFALTRDTIAASVPYEGFTEALATVEGAMAGAAAEGRPIDLLLGFSQGATLACFCLAMGMVAKAVLVAPYPIRDPTLAAQLEGARVTGRALLVTGDADTLVSASESELAVGRICEVTVLRHHAGHVIPSGSALKAALLQFCT